MNRICLVCGGPITPVMDEDMKGVVVFWYHDNRDGWYQGRQMDHEVEVREP